MAWYRSDQFGTTPVVTLNEEVIDVDLSFYSETIGTGRSGRQSE
jgi:hypothetical protein